MANQHPFAKKVHLLPTPVRLGIVLVLVVLTALAVSAVLPWMAQAGPTFTGNVPVNFAVPDAIKAAQATGACCVPGGLCAEEVTAVFCQHILQGTYKGDGTSCVGATCDDSAIGACCLPDGSCAFRTQDSCVSLLGQYYGDGTNCATIDCAEPDTGACCLPNETCEQRTQASCVADRGSYQGNGTQCGEGVYCFDTGACCLANGACLDITQEACTVVGGEHQAETSCEPNPCPQPPTTGACCKSDGSCEDNVTATNCTLDGGLYQGNGSDCASVDCAQTGACCLPNGSCQDNVIETACMAVEGAYQGKDSLCSEVTCPQPPPTGACCMAFDGSCQKVTETYCTIVGGAYQGNDTNCDPNPCPQPTTGACCLASGACIVVTEALCVEGTYQGDNTDCDPNPCPVPTGACCLGYAGAYGCTDGLTAVQCFQQTGGDGEIFKGPGSTCASVNCMPISVTKVPNPPTIKEPGGVVTFTVQVSYPQEVTGTWDVKIDSLIDDVYGDLNGRGTCEVSPTCKILSPGDSYTCEFTATVNGAAGDVETDTVTASGRDDITSSSCAEAGSNDVSAQGSATVTVVAGHDYGDAEHPLNNKYPTLLANNGASHGLGSGVYLGACVDGEADGQPTAGADSDDTNVGAPVIGACIGGDDEDGVTFTTLLLAGETANVDVAAHAACMLSAWIDFNADGDWSDDDENVFSGEALIVGTNSLSFSVPAGATVGDTYARFRCTTDGPVEFSGSASDGEVEDYQVTIPPSVQTATGTGAAAFESDKGTIQDLAAVAEGTLTCPAASKPDLDFVHGFFSFNVTGLPAGETVVVTVTLPSAVPVGSEFWKCHEPEGWIQVPIGSDDGDNVITITLVDGGLGDDDGLPNGVIVDPGGPGEQREPSPPPVPVGGIVVPVSRLGLVAPWTGLAALASLAALTVALVRRRRG